MNNEFDEKILRHQKVYSSIVKVYVSESKGIAKYIK